MRCESEGLHGQSPPPDVESERHDAIDEVVAGGDSVEHLLHGNGLLRARRQLFGVPTAPGRFTHVRKATVTLLRVPGQF